MTKKVDHGFVWRVRDDEDHTSLLIPPWSADRTPETRFFAEIFSYLLLPIAVGRRVMTSWVLLAAGPKSREKGR